MEYKQETGHVLVYEADRLLEQVIDTLIIFVAPFRDFRLVPSTLLEDTLQPDERLSSMYKLCVKCKNLVQVRLDDMIYTSGLNTCYSNRMQLVWF